MLSRANAYKFSFFRRTFSNWNCFLYETFNRLTFPRHWVVPPRKTGYTYCTSVWIISFFCISISDPVVFGYSLFIHVYFFLAFAVLLYLLYLPTLNYLRCYFFFLVLFILSRPPVLLLFLVIASTCFMHFLVYSSPAWSTNYLHHCLNESVNKYRTAFLL